MHYDELRSFLNVVKWRWVTTALLRTAGRAALAAALPMLAIAGADWFLHPQGLAIIGIAVCGLAVAAVAGGLELWRIPRRRTPGQVARFIEERVALLPVPPMNDGLVTALDTSSAQATPAFREMILACAAQQLRAISPSQIVPAASVRRATALAIGGVILLVFAAALCRRPIGSAVEVAGLTLFPGSIRIDVAPGDATVRAGQPLRIRAVVRGWGGVLTRFAPSLTIVDRDRQRDAPMARDGDGFGFQLDNVTSSFRYRVSAGSFLSREFTVTASLPPRVRSIDLSYEYPSFSGLGPRNAQDTGDIYAPAGTRVRVRVHTDKPVAAGALALTRTSGHDLRATSDTVLETDLVLARDDSYRIRLTDREGQQSSGDTEYFIRIMDDRPPDVRILRPSGDQQITPLEEVAIEARADDDYGISTFDLVYSVAGGGEHVVPFDRTSGTGVAKIGSHLLEAEQLRVLPGDVITYYARARDVARGKRPTESKSDIFFLEVRPFNEEFVSAQSQAMAGAAGDQIQGLIEAQKQIISATWNLERRAAAGRSAEDLKAVSRAQAELKTRVERMTAGGGGSQFRGPQQIVNPAHQRPTHSSGEDAVGGAIQSMGRAVQQLDQQQTRLAIPHEMAALQGLLEAQAEVRRQQVAQQANGAASGGAGRQGQDLSALFDKELQRQQRTNYETRSQIEERPDAHKGDAALDRIRELARRQEDLSRRQRELAAAGLAEEELKRQLERLTREQTELREQAEALARQMSGASSEEQSRRGESQRDGGRRGAPQQTGAADRNGSGEGAGSEARQASDDMRSAASDLRRQDPGAAADSGASAARRLRRLEQRMSAGMPDAGARVTGELQLEAQQLADAQRRVAAEAARLANGTSSKADARRRLAADKEALAERVDALQRAADQAAKRGQGARAAQPVADAARELQQQRVGERMRRSAQALRDPNTAPSPDDEQQLAQALDRVAEKLGGARSADAQQLSEQLGQTQGIRQRLDDLARRLRDAEAQQNARGRAGTPAADGGRGARGQQGSDGSGAPGDLQRLREEYARELQKVRETLGRLQQTPPRDGTGGSTPERPEPSLSAPGNEAFKQDFAKWESLRKDIDLALERQEAVVSDRLAKKLAEDRLSAGGSDRVPEAYRRPISRYYELLARSKK